MEHWNIGPSWRGLYRNRICDCNISETKVLLFRTRNSGLGQRFRENGKVPACALYASRGDFMT